jgi:hypothetical protein
VDPALMAVLAEVRDSSWPHPLNHGKLHHFSPKDQNQLSPPGTWGSIMEGAHAVIPNEKPTYLVSILNILSKKKVCYRHFN